MKLNRQAVIDTIDEIEAERAQRHADAQQPRMDAWNEAVRKYKEEDAPQLLSVLRGLVDRVRKGTLTTAGDLTTALGTGNEGFYFVPPRDPTVPRGGYKSITERPTLTAYTPDRELAALRKILVDMTDDESVTTSVLREMGFSPSLFIKKMVG